MTDLDWVPQGASALVGWLPAIALALAALAAGAWWFTQRRRPCSCAAPSGAGGKRRNATREVTECPPWSAGWAAGVVGGVTVAAGSHRSRFPSQPHGRRLPAGRRGWFGHVPDC